MVQGDLIIPENSRIMTRSRAKANPDRYTTVSVPLKIVKLLVQELGPNVAEAQQRLLAKQAAEQGGVIQVPDDEEGEEEWEDEPEGLNIPGMSREELLALGASGRTSRQADDETYVSSPKCLAVWGVVTDENVIGGVGVVLQRGFGKQYWWLP